MKVAIYQVVPELDRTRMLYNSLEFIRKVHNGIVPAEAYEMVYEGEVEAETTEDIFIVFNVKFPKDYKGRSLSVSDVVEIIKSDSKNEFYFCDTIGFKRIKFKKEKAMTLVQNHNYDCVHEKQENVSVFFIGQNGLEQVKCKSFELLRCKYSETQLGYRIRCNIIWDVKNNKILSIEDGVSRLMEGMIDPITKYGLTENEIKAVEELFKQINDTEEE